jgi:hypothetical protein
LLNVVVLDVIAEPVAARSERIKVAAGQMLRELTLLGFANMMDYMRIGGIPGYPAILQNPRKPEIQAALQELVAARNAPGSQEWHGGTLRGKPHHRILASVGKTGYPLGSCAPTFGWKVAPEASASAGAS